MELHIDVEWNDVACMQLSSLIIAGCRCLSLFVTVRLLATVAIVHGMDLACILPRPFI